MIDYMSTWLVWAVGENQTGYGSSCASSSKSWGPAKVSVSSTNSSSTFTFTQSPNRAYIDNKLWWQVPVGTYSLKEDSEDSKTSKSERDRGDHFIFQWGLVKGISNAKSRLFTTLHILKEVHWILTFSRSEGSDLSLKLYLYY